MFKIEVAVSKEMSPKDKGDLLEKLTADIITCLDYTTTSQVRITGMEIDVLAEHNISKDKILVECKANNSEPLSADVLTKLIGNIAVNKAKAGWLFFTGSLSKDAKGLVEQINNDDGLRQQIQIYSPEHLIEILVKNKRIKSYDRIILSQQNNYSENRYFLITPYGMYWGIPILSDGVEASLLVYNATTNEPVSDRNLLNKLSALDTSLKRLEWLYTEVDTERIKKDIRKQKDNIVPVSCGDEWADYRPSRPQDYVGRADLLSSMIKFLDSVRKGETSTRLVGLSAPSGWGKSSTIVKLISNTKNKRNKNNIYVYGVDTRAAVSDKYAELVLLKCLNQAVEDGFLPSMFNNGIQLGGALDILDSDSLREVFRYLKQKNKVILVYFDQFEELFLNNELSELFAKFRQLIDSVCAVKENLVVGFSWKTNINIPSDYPAYNIWHNYNDRRKTFDLGLFTSKDVAITITKLEKESGKKLDAKLKRNLTEHCQGYPWLLKKLCIYVYKSLQNETETEILFQKLNVEGLFKQDLENLTDDEKACIETIARKSPVKEIEISQLFSADVINTLFSKRLLIRSGLNISLYWDIFKDYVLTHKTPIVLEKYICCSRPQRYYKVIEALLKGKSPLDISEEFNLSNGTLDNVFRDAVMIGNIKKSRNSIEMLQKDEENVISTIRQFFQEHELYDILKKQSEEQIITQADFVNIIRDTHPNFATQTYIAYSQTMLEWLRVCGLILLDGDKISICNTSENTKKYLTEKSSNNNSMNSFRGSAPYHKVDSFLQKLFDRQKLEQSVTQEKGVRNVIALLKQFDLIKVDGEFLLPTCDSYDDTMSALKKLVKSTREMVVISQIIEKRPNISGPELGKIINEQFDYNWKPSSEVRIGNALKLWHFSINNASYYKLSLF